MNYFLQELKKIIRIFLSDPKPLAAGIIAPSLILIAFSLIFGSLSSLPVTIINLDNGPQGKLLEHAILMAESPLGGMPYFTNIPLSHEDAESALKNNLITGYIIIPKDFSQCIDNQQYPRIEFGFNNYNSDFGKNMRLYLHEGIFAYYLKNFDDMNIRIHKILPGGIQVDWVRIIATGSLLLATIIGAMFFYLYLYFKEVQHNTLIFYRISPLDYFKVHLARVAASWLFSLITGGINILLARALTGLNLFSHYSFIIIILSLVSFIYIGLCSIVCLYLKQFFSSALISMFGCVLIWFIGGGMNAASFIEQKNIVTFISYLFPNKYALELLRGQVFGYTLAPGSLDWIILLIMFVCVMVLSFFLVRRKLWKNR